MSGPFLPYTLPAFQMVISWSNFILPIPPTFAIVPPINNFGYNIAVRLWQYSALWMHTLLHHPPHPKTVRPDIAASQIEYEQISPTPICLFMNLLILLLYGDRKLAIALARKIGMHLPYSNLWFQILYPALTFQRTPYHVNWGVHTVIPNAIKISHVPHGDFAYYTNKRFATNPSFF